jgi:hypothetical protein
MAQSLLIDENPLIILPKLASCLGLGEAIIVQQLHFLLSVPKNGRERNGHRWIYNTYEQWQRDHFPFWDVATIQRGFDALEQMHVVVSCQPDGRGSRQKYYRLNEGMINLMRSGRLNPAVDGKGKKLNREERICIISEHSKLLSSNVANCNDGNIANCYHPIISTKTTKEYTPSPEALEFADWFKSTLAHTHLLSENWRTSYAQAFDDNVFLDKRPRESVWAVARFGRGDPFWRRNFLSPLKLRKKDDEGVKYFDKIAAKMGDAPKNQTRVATVSAVEWSEFRVANPDDEWQCGDSFGNSPQHVRDKCLKWRKNATTVAV